MDAIGMPPAYDLVVGLVAVLLFLPATVLVTRLFFYSGKHRSTEKKKI